VGEKLLSRVLAPLGDPYRARTLYSHYFMPEPSYEGCGQKSGDYRACPCSTGSKSLKLQGLMG
jgi:hypothetical protein